MRYGKLSSHLSKHSILFISSEFVMIYCACALFFSFFYWELSGRIWEDYFAFKQGNIDFLQSLYFSFIAQSTAGFGDLTPIGYAQTLAIIQGILGMVLSGLWVGILVAKWFTSGSRDSILFAEWAGYSLEEERFFVLFVNRCIDDLVDVNINSIVKLASYNPVQPSLNAPYIGTSAWTFALQKVPINILAGLDLFQGDGIKVSISGTAGMTRCTNWRKYELNQVFVVPDRSYFWNDLFDKPKFDKEFFDNFNNPCIKNAMPFLEFDFQAENNRRKKYLK
jgi:hypothetical protein